MQRPTRTLTILLLALLSLPMVVAPANTAGAATITLAWDPNPPDDGHTGYKIRYSDSTPEANPREVDVGNVTQYSVTNLTAGLAYFFTAVAYNAAGAVSLPSNMVVGTAQGDPNDPCAYPLGAMAINIFPTKLATTGNNGVGSKARLDFQIASPGAPVTQVSILGQGADLIKITGQDVTAIAGLWFTVPAFPATLSISATNSAGCTRVQGTSFSTKP